MIETPRLTLKLPEEADLDAWSAIDLDADLRKFLGGPRPRSVTWRTIAMLRGSWAMRGYGMFSIFERESGRWAGYGGPIRPEGWPGNEIGWALAPWAMGRGYATEAARHSMQWMFDEHDWTEVIHCIHPENAASIRVAERLGSQPLGPVTLPEPMQDVPMMAWGQKRP